METPMNDEYRDEHFHDTKEHGWAWVLLNETLHLIVLVYVLYGMISFRVKFIRMVRLVNWITKIMVLHSWSLTIKFALITLTMFCFNHQLEVAMIPLTDLNCSLANAKILLTNRVVLEVDEEEAAAAAATKAAGSAASQMRGGGPGISIWPIIFFARRHPSLYVKILDVIGGPYKMLGNQVTLMYGFYAFSIYTMLALFPLQLFYCDVGFNYTRFVLNDTSCMRDLYEKKKRHLSRLENWSRNNINSSLTTAIKQVLANQRDLRSIYALSVEDQTPQSRRGDPWFPIETEIGDDEVDDAADFGRYADQEAAATAAAGTESRQQQRPPHDVEAPAQQTTRPTRSLRSSFIKDHMEQPSYNVKVANKNMNKFKPYVRSESWFKISMVVYPIFVSYYFLSLTVVIGAISFYMTAALRTLSESCGPIDLFANWSLLDKFTFYETQYSVLALSCASSFYCSYYFGTILELVVWICELTQQLSLCKVLIDMTANPSIAQQLAGIPPITHDGHGPPRHWHRYSIQPTTTDEGTSPLADNLHHYHHAHGDGDHDDQVHPDSVEQYFNHFGGLRSIWAYIRFIRLSQAQKLRVRELMAIRLASKRQTTIRAAYVNLCLFYDELRDVRFMTKTILSRTTQIAMVFAFMASITHSQLQANYLHLTILLASCLAILNMYLICAALINNGINDLLPRIHSIVCASILAGTDLDLLEFWLRHLQGTEENAEAYTVFGCRVTWGSILNFDGAVTSAYLYSMIR